MSSPSGFDPPRPEGTPPPPPPAAGGQAGAQPPPPPYAPPPQEPSYGMPSAPMSQWGQPQPDRPPVPLAGALLLAGAVLALLGSFLPWFSVGPTDVNGFGDEFGGGRDGPFFAGLAVILAGFGITLLVARRVLAVAIIAVVVSALGLVGAIADYGDVTDIADATFVDADAGPGLIVVIVGALCGLAGGIVAIAKRRQ